MAGETIGTPAPLLPIDCGPDTWKASLVRAWVVGGGEDDEGGGGDEDATPDPEDDAPSGDDLAEIAKDAARAIASAGGDVGTAAGDLLEEAANNGGLSHPIGDALTDFGENLEDGVKEIMPWLDHVSIGPAVGRGKSGNLTLGMEVRLEHEWHKFEFGVDEEDGFCVTLAASSYLIMKTRLGYDEGSIDGGHGVVLRAKGWMPDWSPVGVEVIVTADGHDLIEDSWGAVIVGFDLSWRGWGGKK